MSRPLTHSSPGGRSDLALREDEIRAETRNRIVGWSLAIALGLSILWLQWAIAMPPWLKTLSRIWGSITAAIGVGAIAVTVWSAMTRLAALRQAQLTAQREAEVEARQKLRDLITWWSNHLENEYEWLLSTPWEEQQEWAVRRFREVVQDWREENARYSQMTGDEDFAIALQEVGAQGKRLTAIWEARRKLYQWARVHVTPVERVEASLTTAEKIEQKKFEKTEDFEAFRKAKGRNPPDPSDEDD